MGMGADTNTGNAAKERFSAVDRVRKALREDRRTAEAPIEVREMQGGIYLVGTVNSPGIRQAAEEIARTKSGSSAVINELDLEKKTRL